MFERVFTITSASPAGEWYIFTKGRYDWCLKHISLTFLSASGRSFDYVRSTCSLAYIFIFWTGVVMISARHISSFYSATLITFPGRPWGENPQAGHLWVTSLEPYEPCAPRSNYSFLCEKCCSAGRLRAPQLHPLLAACSFLPAFLPHLRPPIGVYNVCLFCAWMSFCFGASNWVVALSCLLKQFWPLPSEYLTLDTTIVLLNFGLVIYFVNWRPCFAWGYWGVTDKDGLSCPPVPRPSDVVPLHSVVLVFWTKLQLSTFQNSPIIVELISPGLWGFDLLLLLVSWIQLVVTDYLMSTAMIETCAYIQRIQEGCPTVRVGQTPENGQIHIYIVCPMLTKKKKQTNKQTNKQNHAPAGTKLRGLPNTMSSQYLTYNCIKCIDVSHRLIIWTSAYDMCNLASMREHVGVARRYGALWKKKVLVHRWEQSVCWRTRKTWEEICFKDW